MSDSVDTSPAMVRERIADLRSWSRWADDQEEPITADKLDAAASMIEALAAERDVLADLPLCRLQLPDGTVPTGTEAALSLWYETANDYRAKFEAMREDRDAALTIVRLADDWHRAYEAVADPGRTDRTAVKVAARRAYAALAEALCLRQRGASDAP